MMVSPLRLCADTQRYKISLLGSQGWARNARSLGLRGAIEFINWGGKEERRGFGKSLSHQHNRAALFLFSVYPLRFYLEKQCEERECPGLGDELGCLCLSYTCDNNSGQ